MPRRKVNENGSTAANSGGTKPRSRRIKKDANAAMEQKLDLVQMYDAQAPSSVQQVPMMHNHNGMMNLHDDSGPMSSHNLYSSPAGSMAGPPPPEYYQPMPQTYQSGMLPPPPAPTAPPPPHGGQTPQQPSQHQFMEPDPPQSPYINQPSHMQQHNHMMIR